PAADRDDAVASPERSRSGGGVLPPRAKDRTGASRRARLLPRVLPGEGREPEAARDAAPGREGRAARAQRLGRSVAADRRRDRGARRGAEQPREGDRSLEAAPAP